MMIQGILRTVKRVLGTATAIVASIAIFCLASGALAQHVYVSQVGDGGATALSAASAPAFIQQFTDTDTGVFQTPLSTIALPVAASGSNNPLTLTGNATTEGQLNLSANGQYLTLGGYAAAPGVAAVPQTKSSATPRVIGRIKLSDGSVDTSTALSDAYDSTGIASNSNIRSAVSDDGTHFWTTGTNAANATGNASGGVRYSLLGGTTSVQITNPPTNTRSVNIENVTGSNQLYLSTMSGAFRGVNTVGTGLPTTASTVTLLNGFDPGTAATESAYGFWFKDANTLYVADDETGATVANAGVQKWTSANGLAGPWTESYVLSVGAGARGLAGTVVGGVPVLYAITADNPSRLAMVTDTGVASVFATLAVAPANSQFRGVAFAAPVIVPTGVFGDYNDNGFVDTADYTVWRDHLGQTAPGYVLPHENPTTTPGSVTAEDYDYWKAHFGEHFPGSGAGSLGSGAVPEPGSIALLVVGVIGLIASRRRFGR